MRGIKNPLLLLLITTVITGLVGCVTGPMAVKPTTKAVAVIQPLQDSGIKGIVTFIQEGSGVRIVAEITGLPPGKHGFHIHEFGDGTAAEGVSLGGHFNPANTTHGGPEDQERHIGDLGNLEADKSGRAKYNRLDTRIALHGRNSIIGRSVVIKEKVDDYKTQPGGGAGQRIAYGIIGISSLPFGE
ncbi:MAG: superoxide dismutase family protein [Spirochaetaceae bacterium]|nr:MAG: superoxide dismutase family protein [Spirochaetaceae bacterium]